MDWRILSSDERPTKLLRKKKLTMLNTIGRPLLAVAVSANGASPILLSVKEPKVIVCHCLT